MRRRLTLLLVILVALWVDPASAQSAFIGSGDDQLEGVGWSGFTDVPFLLETLLTLSVAAILGAIIAYHPRTRHAIDTVEEAEAPKPTITYAVVGAVIGLMVVEYGLVVGFVVFGIGGLIRFRTALPSATETGRLIFVTLIGLSAGLDLPHLAVLATAFGFGLIYLLETRITYSLEIQGLSEDQVADATAAYRTALEKQRCRIVSQKQSLSKGRATFVFQTSPDHSREELEVALERSVPDRLRGTVNWEVA